MHRRAFPGRQSGTWVPRSWPCRRSRCGMRRALVHCRGSVSLNTEGPVHRQAGRSLHPSPRIRFSELEDGTFSPCSPPLAARRTLVRPLSGYLHEPSGPISTRFLVRTIAGFPTLLMQSLHSLCSTGADVDPPRRSFERMSSLFPCARPARAHDAPAIEPGRVRAQLHR